ncbi:MAG: heat-inducible transcriptional repressor HrcA [Hydrogenophilus sp.]|nr:heat-inducible transcriptional repressor HrcA [Hydrogenophilus sp.]
MARSNENLPRPQPQLDERSRVLLKTLVERYIAEGQPIGSRTLSRASGLSLSAATIRNIMSDLEELGLVASPHTSAGRTPTAAGYRFYLDKLLTVQPLDERLIADLRAELQPDQPQILLKRASHLLAELTRFAGVVMAPRRDAERLKHLEFVPLSGQRVLLILVTETGEVLNRLLLAPRPFTANELIEASNYLTAHFAGKTLEEMRDGLATELAQLKDDISELMRAVLTAPLDPEDPCVVAGENQLLEVSDFANNMARLRELFQLFEQRTALMRLLEQGAQASGVQIFIGSESGFSELESCAVVTANYRIEGRIVGSIGVIGPTRMAYDRVIPLVDITAKILSQSFSQLEELNAP